jgi:hypothetical protein
MSIGLGYGQRSAYSTSAKEVHTTAAAVAAAGRLLVIVIVHSCNKLSQAFISTDVVLL